MLSCDALQQNREQVVGLQAYFEIWAIEVGTGGKTDSSVDCEILFVYIHVP